MIGDYIVDFYCHAAGLVVEIDGGQHFYGEGLESDEIRDSRLTALGLKVLRFSNLDVLQNTDEVREQIYLSLNPPEFGLTVVSLRSRDFCAVSRLRPIPHLFGIVPLYKGGKMIFLAFQLLLFP